MSRRCVFVLCVIGLMPFTASCSVTNVPLQPVTVADTLTTRYQLWSGEKTSLSVNCKNVGESITLTPTTCTKDGKLQLFVQGWKPICDNNPYPHWRWVPDKTYTATLQPSQIAAVAQKADDRYPSQGAEIVFRFEYDFLSKEDTEVGELQAYLDHAEVTVYAPADTIKSLGL